VWHTDISIELPGVRLLRIQVQLDFIDLPIVFNQLCFDMPDKDDSVDLPVVFRVRVQLEDIDAAIIFQLLLVPLESQQRARTMLHFACSR
jgi:hypothetical protein